MSDEKPNQPQMNADERRYKHQELTEQIIGVFYEVYNELGYGFLEKIYEEAMARVLKAKGFQVHQQASIPVWFRGQTIGVYDADLVINDVVLVELKACKALDPSHEAQLLHYLRSTEIEIGLLLNFGPRPRVCRLAFDNSRRKIGVHLRKSAANPSS
jgi:GxxExxY protein